MQNELPRQLDRLFFRAEDMAAGCLAHEGTIGLMQNRTANLGPEFEAARTAENTFQAARTGKLNAFAAQATAEEDALAFLVKARDVLKVHLGNSYSQMWNEAGFKDNSIALPTALPKRIPLLVNLKAYFIAHPPHESPDLGVTAAAAEAAHSALAAARATVNACRTDAGTKKGLRNAAVKTLRKRMRGLITELKQLLPGDDARWTSFGLNRPDAVGLPEVPEGLLVVGGGPGHLLSTWGSSALGDRYRVYKKVVGVDNEFILVATVTDTESNLNTFTSGQVVRVRVTAMNDAGESLPSATVEQTVP
jgi:hypothetical protein